MFDDRDILAQKGAILRRLCVEAHNAVVRDSGGYSDVGEVTRALTPNFSNMVQKSPEHLMLSSYAFWGSRRLGGSRRGFEKRLKRAAHPGLRQLHEYVRAGTYGAWKCVEVGNDSSRWEAIGPARDSSAEVDAVTTGASELAVLEDGEVRAGWVVGFENSAALMYSLTLTDEAVGRLAQAAAEQAWHDEDAASESEIRVVEYERDVLTQAVAPGEAECGLEPYYYLPATVRKRFPGRFRRSLLRTMVDAVGSRQIPWHVRLAKAEPEWIDEFVISKLDQWRAKARRRAQHNYEKRVDDDDLVRVVDDRQCLAMLGLTEDGGVAMEAFPAVKLHPVAMLDVDWEWLEECGVRSQDLIHNARQIVKKDDDRERFEDAVARHKIRVRWCAIVREAMGRKEFHGRLLEPDYREWRQAAEQVFGPIIVELPLSELLADHSRLASRTETALEKAGVGDKPLTVGDLPERGYELGNISGIGPKTVKAIETALSEAMWGWPDELCELDPDDGKEARGEIEDGLDALEELF